MSALSELLASRTPLDDSQVTHLQRLVAEWQLVSDLSFSDLLLWVPVGEHRYVCAAHCRPTTGPTAYVTDQVGGLMLLPRAQLLDLASGEGRIIREAIPVRFGDEVIAVVGRDTNLAGVRGPSQLELVYLQSAADLAGMIADGSFPPPTSHPEESAGPRVGDGIVRVEPDGTIVYASPNALSAFSRLGVGGNVLGEPVSTLTGTVADDPFDAGDLAKAVDDAIAGGMPLSIELDGGGATVLFRALPLRPHGRSLGALLLLQDVTELRRRDRALMSKDATIREIHHRVKNNLQTVAALLRLQARRVHVPEARQALEESMRRIASIALVHETLSESLDTDLPFDAIVDRLLGMLGDVAGSQDGVTLRRVGSFGEVPVERASALVLVLTELVQNAVEHAFGGVGSGTVEVAARRSRGQLTVTVTDDGRGLPTDFDDSASERLGLQIVRTLVSAELRGQLRLEARKDGRSGTRATVALSLHRRPL